MTIEQELPVEGEALQPAPPPDSEYYVDQEGNYLGSFAGAQPPSGSNQVPSAPTHYLQKWTKEGWTAPPKPIRSIHSAWFKAALATLGKLTQVNTAVSSLPIAKQVLWQCVTTVSDDDSDVQRIASLLNIDLDQVFDVGEQLRATK